MDTLEPLILDLLEDLRGGPQPAREVLERWRTSCPRLPVWEEVTDRRLVVRLAVTGSEAEVALTSTGRALLDERRPR